MLKSVSFWTPSSEGTSTQVYNFPIEEQDFMMVTDVTGLEPVKAEFATTTLASLDGEVYQATHKGQRNVVMDIQLSSPDPSNYDISYLRQILYQYLWPGRLLDLRVEDDSLAEVAYVPVRIESLEPKLFTAEPTIQVSIIAFDPYFYSLVQSNFTGNAGVILNVPYTGTAPTGYTLEVTASRAVTSPIYFVNPYDGSIATGLTVAYSMGLNGKMRMSTVKGSKSLQYRDPEGGVYSSILSQISNGSLNLMIGPAAKKAGAVITGATMTNAVAMSWRTAYSGF